jgi:DNA-binding transcriptional ArsR family regulator
VPPRPAAQTLASSAAAPASARTAPGATKATVLAALKGASAMTTGEIAAATGLGRATVSTTLSKLAGSGAIAKAARGYQAQISERRREANRLHKALEDSGIKLDCGKANVGLVAEDTNARLSPGTEPELHNRVSDRDVLDPDPLIVVIKRREDADLLHRLRQAGHLVAGALQRLKPVVGDESDRKSLGGLARVKHSQAHDFSISVATVSLDRDQPPNVHVVVTVDRVGSALYADPRHFALPCEPVYPSHVIEFG